MSDRTINKVADKLDELRSRAENFVEQSQNSHLTCLTNDISVLLHELEVYQVEIEMQNQELRDSEERLLKANEYRRALFDNSPLGYVVINNQGDIHEFNPAADNLFQYPHSLTTVNLGVFMDKKQGRKFQDTIKKAEEESESTCEIQFSRFRESNLRWLRIDISHLLSEFYDHSIFICALTDVTKEKNYTFNLLMAKKTIEREVEKQTRDLRSANEMLKESEQRQKVLFENSREAMMTLTTNPLRFTSANPACLAMFDFDTEEEFISLGPLELSPERQPDGTPSDEKAAGYIAEAMHNGSCFFEWSHQSRVGREFEATILLNAIMFRGETILQATIRDITQQKKNELALQKQRKLDSSLAICATNLLASFPAHENLLKEVLEILLKTVEADRIQIMKNMIDQDGQICMAKTYKACASGVSVKVNDYNLNLVPYDNGFSRWYNFFSQRQVILGPIDSFPISEQLILKEHNIYSIIALPIWVNGQLDGFIALHDLHSPRRWSNEVISFLQTSIDMIGAFLGAQQSSEKLRREQDKLQALVDSANDIIYTISMETERFEYISPGWRPMLGHDPKEVIGTSFKDYVHPDDIEKCQAFLERLVVTGQPQSGVEYRVRHKNGSSG